MKRTIIILAIWSIVLCFQSGCTYNVPPIDSTLTQKPLIEKFPIRVGIYYDDVFRAFECVKRPYPHYFKTRIVLGPPSVTLFDQILSEMFEKVIQVNILPLLPQAEPDIKAVIQPTIVSLTIQTDEKISWTEVNITYKITLYELNGAHIANWSINGSGSSLASLKNLHFTHSSMIGEAVKNAMRNVAAKFMLGFRKNPEAMKWLRNIGITASF